MAYRFRRDETVLDGIQRIACGELDAALEAAACDDPEKMPVAVHQLRKRCKKLRGLIRLVRSGFEETYAIENSSFRDIARLVSGARDVQTMLDTYDALMEHFAAQVERRAFAPLRRKLTLHHQQLLSEEARVPDRLEEARQRLSEARARVGDWSLKGKPTRIVFDGLQNTYRRGVDAMDAAVTEETPEAFHQWRKRVKYHWYHCRLLRKIWPEMLQPQLAAGKHLADELGHDHDLAVLKQHLETHDDVFRDPQDSAIFTGLIDQRQRQIRQSVRLLGSRLFAEEPEALGQRWRVYWKLWRSQEEVGA